MKAIIHCGGYGTRLPEISKKMPKPMVELNNKPLLLWHIQNLKESNVRKILITTHYMPEIIKEYFGNGEKFGVEIEYSFEKKLLGTGGSLLSIEDYIDENIILIYGDVFAKVDYQKMFRFHIKKTGTITAAIHPSRHPEDSDLVLFDQNYKLTKLIKKPHTTIPSNPYNLAALYIFSPEIRTYLTLTAPFDMAQDLIPWILKSDGKIFCYNTPEFIMDIGTPRRLHHIQTLIKNDNL